MKLEIHKPSKLKNMNRFLFDSCDHSERAISRRKWGILISQYNNETYVKWKWIHLNVYGSTYYRCNVSEIFTIII